MRLLLQLFFAVSLIRASDSKFLQKNFKGLVSYTSATVIPTNIAQSAQNVYFQKVISSFALITTFSLNQVHAIENGKKTKKPKVLEVFFLLIPLCAFTVTNYDLFRLI